jgi:hypothetical protein
MRLSLVFLLLCCSGLARADWTGVEFELGDIDADWEFADGTHSTGIRSLGFRIEERAVGGLSVGGGLAYQELRVAGKGETDSKDFSTANFEIYLRQQVPLGESVLLQGLLSYGYYGGYENTSREDRADINWSQVDLEISAGFKFASVRLTPYARYTNVDGDIRNDQGSLNFELEDPYSYGFRFDIFLEETAFITIRLQDGSQSGGYLTFVRRY